ncbi:ACP S-malonyltransferase [Gemmatimonas aurantiaca]|nr:ACP S-malonyltransferase [Gemmatimonas aurantiaca]
MQNDIQTMIALFPGQASQYVGMGKDLYENFEEARRLFDFASQEVGEDLSKITFEGPPETLKRTRFTQPAILTHSLAVLAFITAERPGRFAAVAGHSLGEYGALVAAGALSAENAIRLVSQRAELMEQASQAKPGTMAAIINMSAEDIVTLCDDASTDDEVVVAANINSATQIVISGDTAAVERAVGMAKERGAKRALLLEVGGAFHSPLMASAKTGMEKALNDVEISDPQTTFIANVSAQAETSGAEIRTLLVEQITSPVRWSETMTALKAVEPQVVVEIGPSKVLSGLAKRSLAPDRLVSLDTLADIEYFLKPSPVS